MTTFKDAQRIRSKPVARSGVPRKFDACDGATMEQIKRTEPLRTQQI